MLVSHDVELAARIADGAIVLAAGSVCHAQGTATGDTSTRLDPETLERAYIDASAGGHT